MSNKKIPGWYRVYLEKRLAKLELALGWINYADRAFNRDLLYAARTKLNIAKRILNQ